MGIFIGPSACLLIRSIDTRRFSLGSKPEHPLRPTSLFGLSSAAGASDEHLRCRGPTRALALGSRRCCCRSGGEGSTETTTTVTLARSSVAGSLGCRWHEPAYDCVRLSQWQSGSRPWRRVRTACVRFLSDPLRQTWPMHANKMVMTAMAMPTTDARRASTQCNANYWT